MRAISGLLGVLFLCLGLAAPVYSQNPRLSLSIEAATFAEAAAALSQASGVRIALFQWPPQPGIAPPPANPLLLERASFDWRSVTFADALRQLCARYQLRPLARGQGYELASAAGPKLPAKLVGSFEKENVRMCVLGVSVSESGSRNLGFMDGRADEHADVRMGLMIGGWVKDGEGRAVARIENVVARDDQGTILVGNGAEAFYNGYTLGAYPDEWNRPVGFGPAHPKARKLEWVEGELWMFSKTARHRQELPISSLDGVLKTEVGGVTFVLSRYRMIPKGEIERDRIEVPALGGLSSRPENWGASFRMQTVAEGMPDSWTRQSTNTTPGAVGASGRVYPGVLQGGSGRGTREAFISEGTLVFAGMEEPPVKLVWDFTEWAEPVKRFSFRLNDIPLPPPPNSPLFQPRRTVPQRSTSKPTGDRPSFYEEGGGTLVVPVQVLARPAAPGTLQLGLAPRAGAGWGGIRWVELPVASDGTARLEHVRPGVYRLLRAYRPKETLTISGSGRWLNGEVQAQVTAGKEIRVPALEWVPEAAPGQKPARMR